MPIVQVNVWKGFGEEKAKTVIQNITKVFVDLGIPGYSQDYHNLFLYFKYNRRNHYFFTGKSVFKSRLFS